MGQRLLVLAAAALAGCAASGEVALSPLARQVPAVPLPDGPCASLVYGLSCVAPPGYDLAEEGPGPGIVMRYTSREEAAAERAHLILRAYPLGPRKLSWVVDDDILKPLRGAPGVSDVRLREASLGARRGLAILARRDGDGWSYVHEFFAFQHAGTAFVVEHAVPAPRLERERHVLSDFVSSLSFRD